MKITLSWSSVMTCVVAILATSSPLLAQTATVAAPGRYADINGMKMYYEVHGTGEPLLLLHWYDGTGAASWGPFVKDLSFKYKLIIPDMRGHGRTINPADAFSFSQCADDVVQLLDHLRIGRCRAMGASLGGMTLLQIATRQPERISSMVLIGSGHYLPEQARREMRRETKALYFDNPKHWAEMETLHPGGKEQIQKLARLFSAIADDYADLNFTPPYLGTIQARTLIMHGDRDQYFPVDIPVEIYKSIPNSALWIVPKGGHLPHMNMPNEFVQRTLQFMDAEDHRPGDDTRR
ncbi:MAG: alpha/beta hydrolase [Pirellulaceae bacterium]